MSARGERPFDLDALRSAAREDGPTAAEEKELEARVLSLVGGAGGAGSGNGSPGTVGGGGALSAKATVVTVGLVAVAVGLAVFSLEPPAPAPVPSPAPPAPRVIAPPARGDRPRPVDEPLPSPPLPPIVGPSDAIPVHATSEPAHRAPSPPRVAPPEHALVARARALLAAEPERALAAARRHQALYANGALAEERDVLVVEALSRLGRCASARDRAEAFAVRFPTSPYHDRVGAAIQCSHEGETP